MIKPSINIFILLMSLVYVTHAGVQSNFQHVLIEHEEKQDLKPLIGYKPYAKVLNTRQVRCLTENIYFEARNEKEAGKIAVALVTLNRVHRKRYPSTVCGVVYQRSRYKCQFSWTCMRDRRIKYMDLYKESENIAKNVLLNYDVMKDVTHGATNFHRRDVRPRWALPKFKTTVIGKHIFYKL